MLFNFNWFKCFNFNTSVFTLFNSTKVTELPPVCERAAISAKPILFVKDGLPYLFHSFRNKYFNKISLGNMLYFQNKL